MKEMQRQFEKWAAKEGYKMERAPEPWFYEWASTACAWRAWQKAWQASRAAVVVKLPDWDCYDTPRQALEACEGRLSDAGVSYE